MFFTFLLDYSNIDWTFWLMIGIWLSIFIVTLYIELNTADVTIIWFCLSSLVCFILALFNIYFIIQIIVFAVTSFVLILVTRPLAKKMMNKSLIRTNADKIISKIAIVTKQITENEIGEVKIENELWRAITFDNESIEVNEKVSIVSFNGNKVVVKKIKKENNINII